MSEQKFRLIQRHLNRALRRVLEGERALSQAGIVMQPLRDAAMEMEAAYAELGLAVMCERELVRRSKLN